MANQEIKCLIEGGRASPAPPLGPALGPTGVNIGAVIGKINQETSKFSGMKVPVTIIIKPDRSFEVKVGLPTTSGLILKEAGLAKGGHGSTEEVPEEPCGREEGKIVLRIHGPDSRPTLRGNAPI